MNIKDKLFSCYKKDILSVPFMAFALVIRLLGWILAAFLFLCTCIGLAIPVAILFGIARPSMWLIKKLKREEKSQKWIDVMNIEFCNKVFAVLEFWVNL